MTRLTCFLIICISVYIANASYNKIKIAIIIVKDGVDMDSKIHFLHLLVYSINSDDCNILQNDHDKQGQSSWVVIKHCHKVISRALHKDQANKKCYQAADDWNKGQKCEYNYNKEWLDKEWLTHYFTKVKSITFYCLGVLNFKNISNPTSIL